MPIIIQNAVCVHNYSVLDYLQSARVLHLRNVFLPLQQPFVFSEQEIWQEGSKTKHLHTYVDIKGSNKPDNTCILCWMTTVLVLEQP